MGQIENYQIGHTTISHGEGFKIECGINRNGNVEKETSHRHNFHAIYWIHKGEGTHVIDFNEYEMKPNRIFYMKPEQVHFFKEDVNIIYSALQFTDEFMLSYHVESNKAVVKNEPTIYKDLDNNEQERIQTLFELISNESATGLKNSAAIIQAGISYITFGTGTHQERWNNREQHS